MSIKVNLTDKDLSCEHYKMHTKEGKSHSCQCKKGLKGNRKNLRFWFKRFPSN